MRYETTQKYYVKLYPKYLTKTGIIHVNQSYQDRIAQQKLIDLRILAANGSDLARTYTQIIDGKSVSDLPYFSIEKHTIDIDSPRNREVLLSAYCDYKNLARLDNNAEILSFHGYLKKNSQIDVGILTKRVENQNTLCTLLNPAYFSDRFGIIAINIFETFDFENLRVNLKVVLDTETTLTDRELSDLSEDLDGQMADGWGENYEIAKVNEFHDVSGWMFATEPVKPLIPSRHALYYPVNRKGV